MTEININFNKKIDFLTWQLKQQFLDLSENELKLLAIIHLKGVSATIKKEIVKLNIFKSAQTVENHLSKFRKIGILNENKVQLKYPISMASETKIIINLKLSAYKENS
jgi:hypothetical protein